MKKEEGKSDKGTKEGEGRQRWGRGKKLRKKKRKGKRRGKGEREALKNCKALFFFFS